MNNKENYAIKIWDSLIDSLMNDNTITSVSYDNWFSNTKAINLNSENILIEVPDEFSANWIDQNFRDDIEKKLKILLNKEIFLKIKIKEKEKLENFNTEKNINKNFFLWNEYGNYDKITKKKLSNINPKFTFNSFVSGSSNQLAYNLSYSIAEKPGYKYNPLFIYGKSGVGKTHLLQAIGNYIIDNSNKIPLYVTSEAFLTDYVKSIRSKNTLDFRDKYRKIDVLLIDDIQFFSGKEGIQEEFFHTFNHLYQLNKQIIISSDSKPNELSTLAERLRSRFSWGILTDMKVPELETRIAILQNKINKIETIEYINDEVIEYIATNITTNVRDLEGALNAILANLILLDKDEVTLDLAIKSLSSYITTKNEKEKQITIKDIKRNTATYFLISEESFDQKNRKEPLATYRHLCMYLCKKLTNNSLKKIGFEFGKRDHSTVINSIKKIEKKISKNDPNIIKAIKDIKIKLNINN